jgi:hypothetical protein
MPRPRHYSVAVAAAVVTAAVGAQTPLLQVLGDPMPGGASLFGAFGDLDGDGDVDVMNADRTVGLNDGSGRFIPAAVPPVAAPRRATKLADLNGDGLLDVISIAGPWNSNLSNVLAIDMNAPGLSFGPTQNLNYPSAMGFDVGDVDGDGDFDIWVGTWDLYFPIVGSWFPFLLLNNGAGTFTLAPSGSIPWGYPVEGEFVFLCDVDLDGDLDALCVGGGNPYVGTAVVLVNLGGGTFATPVPLPGVLAAQPLYSTAALGDFNGDGRPDLVAAGTYVSTTTGVFHIYMNSPTGFLPPTNLAGSVAARTALAAVDWDADGTDELVRGGGCWGTCPDLAVYDVGATGVVGPLLSTQPQFDFGGLVALGGAFYPGRFGASAVADLDGDGDRDLLATRSGRAALFMNSGALPPPMVAGPTIESPAWLDVVAADADGDGDADLVGFEPGLPVRPCVGLNDSGAYAPGPPSPVVGWSANSLRSAHAFDRDADGDDDLCVVAENGGGTTPLIFNANAGVYTLTASLPTTSELAQLRTCDFDGDGDQDLLLGRRNQWAVAAPMQWVANLGAAGFATPVSIGVGHSTNELLCGDFDGDGFDDVLQVNTRPAALTGPLENSVVYLAGPSPGVAVVQTGVSGTYAAVGDLNGDGFADAVIDGQVRFGAAGGVLTAGPLLTTPLKYPAALADLDGDGDLDLAERAGYVMRNTGAANFAAREGAPSPFLDPATYAYSGPPRVTDLDRDGDLDLVTPGPFVASNTTRHVARGRDACIGRLASLDLFGSPGGPYWLFYALAPANLSNPLFGPVLIEPSTAQLAISGFFGASGATTIVANVPANPALVGLQLFWQGLDGGTAHVTNRHVLTVGSY